jgi:hypothetical protein
VGLVVEGHVDRIAAEKVLASRGVAVDPMRVIITQGRTRFDARIASYNQAARHGGWFALRDSDLDSHGCPATLRRDLLSVPQSPALCLRLAVRTIEAWLLADADAFADHFAVPVRKVPDDPEALDRPKDALVAACRHSRRREVRTAMVPPPGSRGTGPEYTAFIGRFGREVWRPGVAAAVAPSLGRAVTEIDRMIERKLW